MPARMGSSGLVRSVEVVDVKLNLRKQSPSVDKYIRPSGGAHSHYPL
jgi:hypothetical protein